MREPRQPSGGGEGVGDRRVHWAAPPRTHGCLPDLNHRTGTRSPQSRGPGRNRCSIQRRL